MKGLPKSYIKKYGISKKAWREFRKSKSRKVTKRKKNNPKRSGKKTTRRRNSFTIPLGPVLGLAAGMAGPIKKLIDGEVEAAMEIAVENYTGFNIPQQKWNPTSLGRGLIPLVLGLVVHKFVGGAPLNLNRTLARANVPLIRI